MQFLRFSASNFNIDSFLNDLDNCHTFRNDSDDVLLNSSDVIKLWECWKCDFLQIIHKHAPLKQIRVKTRNNPWFNSDLQELIYHRDYLHKKAVKSKDHDIFQAYKHARNDVTNKIRLFKKEYYLTSLDESKFQPKKMWRTLKNVLPSKRKSSNIPTLNTADDFIKFYAGIGENINSKFDSEVTLPDMSSVTKDVNLAFVLEEISQDFVFQSLKFLKNDNTLDVLNFDGKILATAAPIILRSLTKIFNLSLKTGIVPQDWKLARVTPLYKGSGSKSEMGNFRPISVISFIPKIIEHHVKEQLVKYFIDNSLLRHHQFAYLKNHSTVTALHKFIDDVLLNINKGKITGACQIDLTKGFDSINHDILLYKLQCYGITYISLNWFTSYLYHRQQIVSCNGMLSEKENVTIGVPQGTILGPILYLIFVNDIIDILDNLINCIMYADDSSLYCTGNDISEVRSNLQLGLNVASEWFHNNRLLINSLKSSSILLGTRKRVNNVNLDIYISNNVLKQCKESKLLGLIIDESLQWDRHIDYLVKRISPKVGLLYRLSKFLPSTSLKTIYVTLIQPDIDYCVSIWANSANIHMMKIQRLQNRAARIICNNFDRNISSSTLLKSLNIMNIKQRQQYFILILMFKCMNGLAPTTLNDNLNFVNDSHSYVTRASVQNDLTLPKPNCEIFCQSFMYLGPLMWNSLPCHIRNISDIIQFKHIIKNYVMSNVS